MELKNGMVFKKSSSLQPELNPLVPDAHYIKNVQINKLLYKLS